MFVEECKYLLPCGLCDKTNEECEKHKQELQSLQSYLRSKYHIFADNKVCEHDWVNRCGITDTKANIEYSMYTCSKCGDVKAEKFAI